MSFVKYIRFEKDISIASDLEHVLFQVNTDFDPPLQEWVDIKEYACKMASNAVCWLAYCNDEVVGFAACYVNKSPLFSFWTMLAIRKEYRNRMIALQIEPLIISYCREYGSSGLKAEVDPRHIDLIKLHRHFGFVPIGEHSNEIGRSWIELQLSF